MSIDAGSLNCLVDVQVASDAVDASNQPVPGWAPHPTHPKAWAKVMTASGMSAVRAAEGGVPIAPTKYSFAVRYRPTVFNNAMRIVYKGVAYDIRDVRHNHSARDWTFLVCETGGNAG